MWFEVARGTAVEENGVAQCSEIRQGGGYTSSWKPSLLTKQKRKLLVSWGIISRHQTSIEIGNVSWDCRPLHLTKAIDHGSIKLEPEQTTKPKTGPAYEKKSMNKFS